MNIDRQRGERAAELLYKSFRNEGVHGQKDMSDDILPGGIEAGSLEHIFFITLTVAIDYQRDTPALWVSSRRTFEDEETRYLFYPSEVFKAPVSKIVSDMQKHDLARKADKDAYIWRTVASSFLKKYDGNPVNLFKQCNWYATVVLDSVRNARHFYRNKEYPDFPYLRGDKIGPLWLKMLRDNVGLSFVNMNRIPIPVDVHVARSTLALGIVRGRYVGHLKPLFDFIRKAWVMSVQDLRCEDGREMVALDVDEPLRHLSKYGCTARDERGSCNIGSCIAKELCVPGHISIRGNGKVHVNTGG